MAFAMIYASQQQIDLMTHSAALSGLVAGNETFAHATSAHIEELDSHITEYRTLNTGDYLLHEDDEPENIYLVVSGKFDVLKNNNDALKRFSVAQLGRGECIGDVALLDGGKRSATIQALEPSEVAVIPIKALQKTDVSKGPLEYLMKLNLTRNFAERLRRGNEQVVQALEERERKALHEAAMGRFISYVLVGLGLYMFAMGAMQSLTAVLPDTSIVTIPLLCAFAFGVYRAVALSPYPASDYGITLKHWPTVALNAILLSLPVCAIIVVLKWLAVQTIPAWQGAAVLDFSQSTGLSALQIVGFATAYCLFTPVQELVARVGIQRSLELFLTGKHKTVTAIFLSNLLFCATHLHISLELALFVFPVGVFWGWLFAKTQSFLAVSVSHALIGCFGLFVVGVGA